MPHYSFSYDHPLTSNTSSDIALDVTQVIDIFEKQFNNPLISSLLGIYPTFYTVMANHEFGHAIRAKEFGVPVTGFTFNLFGAATHLGQQNNEIEEMIISLAGNESSYILSQKIKSHFYKNNNKISPAFGAAYVFSWGNQFFYTNMFGKDSNGKYRDGHDMESYMIAINKYYNKNYTDMDYISNRGKIDLLDPFLAFSLYSMFTGQEVTIPTIKYRIFTIYESSTNRLWLGD